MSNLMKKISICLCTAAVVISVTAGMPAAVSAASGGNSQVGKYGMLPIYGTDVKDGTYSIGTDTACSEPEIRNAQLQASDGSLEAVITIGAEEYTMLYMGTASDAASAKESGYIDCDESDEGLPAFVMPVDALDKGLECAFYSTGDGKWHDQVILFDASTLPESALLVELPDYDAIESAMKEQQGEESAQAGNDDLESRQPVEAMDIDLEDGEYSIEVTIAGGSGKATVSSPTLMKVKEGKAYAQLVWSSSNYDYMIVGNRKYINTELDGGNSTFVIPIAVMDEEMSVIADTTAMGTPHEVEYTLTFYEETIGPKSQMPQEAAKKVVVVAAVIIIGGGILNHFVNKKRKC